MFDWTIETPLKQVVQEAIGLASMCWEHPEKAGQFDMDLAIRIGEEVMKNLNARNLH
jgi:hypothetical protein